MRAIVAGLVAGTALLYAIKKMRELHASRALSTCSDPSSPGPSTAQPQIEQEQQAADAAQPAVPAVTAEPDVSADLNPVARPLGLLDATTSAAHGLGGVMAAAAAAPPPMVVVAWINPMDVPLPPRRHVRRLRAHRHDDRLRRPRAL